MSGNRFRKIAAPFYINAMDASDDNDAADQIIAAPDRFLLNQEDLFAAQGGMMTVGLSLGLVGMGTLAIFAGAPRTLHHFKNGQLGAYEFACLFASSTFWYNVGQYFGVQSFGDRQAVSNHWMAYTWIKSQNRYLGPYVLHRKPMYY